LFRFDQRESAKAFFDAVNALNGLFQATMFAGLQYAETPDLNNQ
jgi:hypothetical protein